MSGLPVYLCEDCAKRKFRPDLTLGVVQIWLRLSPDPRGYGPRCEFCGNEKTTYQIQIVGLKPDTEGVVTDKMKEELKAATSSP